MVRADLFLGSLAVWNVRGFAAHFARSPIPSRAKRGEDRIPFELFSEYTAFARRSEPRRTQSANFMNIRFYFQKISEADKERLEKDFKDKKLARLTKLLQHGNLELAKFILNAKYHSRHNIFLIRLGLKVINKDLVAEEKSRNLIEAFDLAFTNLIGQLRKLENIKHDK